MLTTRELRTCRDLCVEFLDRHAHLDWTVELPDMDFDIAGMCAHIAQTGYWYAIDFAARGVDLTAVEPQVKAESSAQDLIQAMSVGMDLLGAVIDVAPPSARGFHPFGEADGSGFAAMACDEMLIHTHDIARGVGDDFAPPSEVAGLVLGRLFPWVDGDEDPWTLLQWANGRIGLPERPRLGRWRWHCAPLDEWDGTAPGTD